MAKENEELKQTLVTLEAKANESKELNMRLNSLTNQFSTIRSRTEKQDIELKQLEAERKRLLEENETLKLAAQATVTSSQSLSDASENVGNNRKRPIPIIDDDDQETDPIKRPRSGMYLQKVF